MRRYMVSICLICVFCVNINPVNASAKHSGHNPRNLSRNGSYCAFGFPDPTTFIVQATSGVATYFGLIAYFDRPRGKLMVEESDIEARQSQVEGAGLGLFATKSMPEGTVLGTYPGIVRPAGKYMLKYNGKPDAATYAWRFTDNAELIDPTDKDGNLRDRCFGGTDDFPLSYFLHQNILKWSTPTLLARINEPPIGARGCNVRSEEDLKTREVTFSLSRDVVGGEELFMDYGLTYDRSSYGSPGSSDTN